MYLKLSKITVLYTIFLTSFFLKPGSIYATDTLTQKLVIEDIKISGNKKTKPQIILRELGFLKGDKIFASHIESILLKAKAQLINTSLFLNVVVNKQPLTDSTIEITIIVKERWYIFPAPVFSFADRNFNLWWNQQKRNTERINYGLALDYKNFTGHNDNLDIGFQTGYNPSWGIFYNRPNIGKKQQHEIGIQFINGKSREVNYASMFDKKSFFKLNNFLRYHTEGRINYTYRKNIFTRHYFSVGFMLESVADTVAKLNPDYLGKGKSSVLYPEFIYRFSYNATNNLLYPLKGKSVTVELLRNGVGNANHINTTQLKFETGWFVKLFKKTFFNSYINGKIILSKQQPFLIFRGLGYSDKELFRGLDSYVLDGNAYGVIKNNLKREIFSTNLKANFLPKAFRKIPFQFYLKALFDAGYVANNNAGNNMLVNRWLISKGIGLDIVSFYDINITFEYSFNQWMESGLFFRAKFGLDK